MPTGDAQRLREIVEELQADYPDEDRLGEIIELTRRRRLKQRAPIENRKVTPEVIAEVLDMYSRDPSLSCATIGRALRVNGGRVSEIIAGMYNPQTGEKI